MAISSTNHFAQRARADPHHPTSAPSTRVFGHDFGPRLVLTSALQRLLRGCLGASRPQQEVASVVDEPLGFEEAGADRVARGLFYRRAMPLRLSIGHHAFKSIDRLTYHRFALPQEFEHQKREVSSSYRSHSQPATEVASRNCHPPTGVTLSS